MRPLPLVAVIAKPDVVSHGYAGDRTLLADFCGMRLQPGDLVLLEGTNARFPWCQYAPARYGILVEGEFTILGEL
jgi:hypothetical protein